MKKSIVVAVISFCLMLALPAMAAPIEKQAQPVAAISQALDGISRLNMMFLPHSVSLTWVQGTCAGCTVTGNKVYRGTATGGPYNVIQTFTTPTIAFTDSTVTAGGTYFYVVTSTCSACTTVESVFSTEFKAIIPVDPTQALPPGNLTGTVQ